MKRFIYILILALPVIAMVHFRWYKKLHAQQTTTSNSSLSIQQAQAYVEEILNKKAEFFTQEAVFKITIPRNDLKVSINGFTLDPFMGLATWIGFQKGIKKGIEIMAMGDWALLEHEVHPVMSAALEHNIKITALHNHFFADDPHIYFMHMEVEGTLTDVTASIQAMLSAMMSASKIEHQPLPSEHAIDGDIISDIIATQGTTKDGMFKIVIGREIQASCGCTIGKNMGINSWIAFGGTNDNAVVDGDFALFEDEVQPVLKALKSSGINVVAIHNHLIHEQPRLLYVHFWARGKTDEIAQGLKKAIDQTTMLHDASAESKRKQHGCPGCAKNK